MEETASDTFSSFISLVLLGNKWCFDHQLSNIPSFLLRWFLDVPIFHYSGGNET